MNKKYQSVELVLNIFLLICCLLLVAISIIGKNLLNSLMWLLTGVSFYIPFVIEPKIGQNDDANIKQTSSQKQTQDTKEQPPKK